MKITISPLPTENRKYLVPVPSQKIPGLPNEVVSLEDGHGNEYKVLDKFTYSKSDPWPAGMMLLATGKEVEAEKVWETYKGSDKLHFFIVELME